jgi:hypothetical protein
MAPYLHSAIHLHVVHWDSCTCFHLQSTDRNAHRNCTHPVQYSTQDSKPLFEPRTPVEPSYITHIPPSLYQICNTRSNNNYLRPSFTPTNTQNNLISHTLLWFVNTRRSVVTACHCFVSKWLWVQLRIASCQSAPPTRNNSPRTPHTLPVTQHHRTPCVRPKTQGSQAVAGWRVGGLSWRQQVDGKKHGEKYVTSNTSFWQEIFSHH